MIKAHLWDGPVPGYGDIYPYRRLAGAVLLRAMRDAREGDIAALLWLCANDGGIAYADILGVLDVLYRWLCNPVKIAKR